MILRHAVSGWLALWLAACSTSQQPSGAATPVELGLACGTNADCRTGYCVTEARSGSSVSWTAGTCSEACGAAGTCPTRSSCVTFTDGAALCLPACAQSSDCRAGYVCSSAVSACLPDCRLGFSCGSTLACDQATGTCIAPVGTQAIGADCKTGADCKSAVCTAETSNASGKQWAGGYCTQQCGASAPCADGAACISYDDGSSYCAASCGTGTDCRSGYVCSASAKACLPDCRQGWSCGAAFVCDGSTGNCVGKMLPVGSPCTLNVECASGLCTPAQSNGAVWSGGYCTQLCDSTTSCPSTAKCIAYADGSSCAAACASNSECRTGYVCATSVGGCLPDCRQGWSCGTALTCDSATGTCI